MWTTNSEEAQGVQCLGPLGRAVDTACGFFCAGDGVTAPPLLSPLELCSAHFHPGVRLSLQIQHIAPDPSSPSRQASPRVPSAAPSLISKSPALESWVTSPAGLLHPRQPDLVALRSACTPCTPVSPSCPVTAVAEFRSQSPVAEILRRLSQLVSSPQTSFSFSSSHTSLSDSQC